MKTIHHNHQFYFTDTMKLAFKIIACWTGTIFANSDLQHSTILAMIDFQQASEIVKQIAQVVLWIMQFAAAFFTVSLTLSTLWPQFRRKFFPKKKGVIAILKNITNKTKNEEVL